MDYTYIVITCVGSAIRSTRTYTSSTALLKHIITVRTRVGSGVGPGVQQRIGILHLVVGVPVRIANVTNTRLISMEGTAVCGVDIAGLLYT